jgi:hypothetical protein
VVVKCKIDPPHYRQGGNSIWANDHYDNAFKKNQKTGTLDTVRIKDWGCALSAMAIAMTAFGDTINPGQLNAWMKDKRAPEEGGYYGSSVNWNVIELQSNGAISYESNWNRNFRDPTKATSLSILDQHLKRCELAIVQVYNSRTGNQHWVVVTEKKGGNYHIIDPGRGETTLDGYDSRFWSYVIVRKVQ